jgi:MFS transporter, DHA2 family, multidrug resistance protein
MDKPIKGFMLVCITIAVSLAIFMNILDTSIANVAIPYIAGDLGVSPTQGTWVITSFSVSLAIMLPITGWLAKRFGEIRLFVLSTFLFTICSMLCGLAVNFTMLLIFRVIQGATAGPMIPLSQSILLRIYPEEKKGFATALWSMTAVIAPIFGPIVGGFITYNYAWPWIFYINFPIGIISCIVTWTILKNDETPLLKQPIDYFGLVLLIIGIGALQILLDKGNELDWFNSTFIIALAIISVISLSILIIWEITEYHPIIDLALFKIRNFAIGTIAISLGYLVYFGNIVIFPLWLQTQMGYTAVWAGLATAPVGVLALVFSPLVGNTMHKIDPRIYASIGFSVFAGVSFWCDSFNTNVDFIQLITPRFFQGIGISCFFIPLIMIVISGLDEKRIASALGLTNFLRILGGSFGTSLSVTLWDRREQFHHSQLVQTVSAYNPLANAYRHDLAKLGLNQSSTSAFMDNMITNQAYMLSTNDIFWLSGVLFLLLLMIIWFTKPPFLSATKTIHVAE